MAVQIVHRRSETAGVTPPLTAVQFGEFAVNGADGDVFLKCLVDPAAAPNAENQIMLSIRRPNVADGGEVVSQQ